MFKALRKPKAHVAEMERNRKRIQDDQESVILTLKNSVKLVVTSDSFHCIRNIDYKYNCALCDATMESETKVKENHKNLAEHQRLLITHPYLEDLAENLIRQISNSNCYCTLCSIVTPVHLVTSHVLSNEHKHELDKALLKAKSYRPCENFDLNHNK
ncbi:uncharacterized protein LOC123879336 [Maniola jurtina]|uniref:uncharacterized protein LOC123879336 n=1 Tax=Maniola jurtina TaxID=191418 RepID=UPI001E68816B|nr:uncharacterized protein LOC123879336 [Maniola jurtina]